MFQRLLEIAGKIFFVFAGAGLTGGGWPIVNVVPVALAWAAYAALLTSLGLYFSLTSGTTLRAMAKTMTVLVAMSIAPWLLGLVVRFALVLWLAIPLVDDAGAVDLVTFGWSPPATMRALIAHENGRPTVWERFSDPLPWLLFFIVIAVLFWWLVRMRFSQVTLRMPIFNASALSRSRGKDRANIKTRRLSEGLADASG